MEFTFSEMVKLATKGFKPSDIEEIKQLDDNKFSKEDILSLINNGYSKTMVSDLVGMFKDTEPTTESEPETKEEQSKEPVKKVSRANDDTETDVDKDDIDYKTLYEKEKTLRQRLQHDRTKASSDVKTESDGMTDWEIALDIANNF